MIAPTSLAGFRPEGFASVADGADGTTGGTCPRSILLDDVHDLGECFNAIRFHLYQDQLLWDEGHRNEARDVMERLGRLARNLVPARDRSRFRAEVTSPIRRLLDQLGRGQKYENLTESNHRLRERFPEVDLGRFRKGFVEPNDEAIRDSRAVVERLLDDDDQALLALQLGGILDQGAHPVDPDNFYGSPEGAEKTEAGKRLRPGAVGDARREDGGDLLANRSLRRGEALPAGSWADEVRKLVDELPMLDSAPIGLLTPRDGEGLEHEQVVDVLRESIRARLKEKSSTRPGASGPGVRRPGVSRRGQNEERDRRLYELHLDRGKYWQSIIDEVNLNTEWHPISSLPSAHVAVNRFAKRHKLPGPLPQDSGKRNALPEAHSQLQLSICKSMV